MCCFCSAFFFIYAETLVLVNLILVKFFIKMVITRPHDLRIGRKLAETNPTGIPEPPRQPRTLYNSQKVETNEIPKF